MIRQRKASERGHVRFSWLDTWHSFSFGEYYDPEHMGFSVLRVINDDVIAPEGGFPTHPHRDMEILTYVLDGALAHRDSMGNGSTIEPGDVQRMSAGTGVTHSEFNAAPGRSTHLLQIWFLPGKRGIEPSYEQKRFPDMEKRGRLRLIASPDGADGSVSIHQDAQLYAGLFDGNESAELHLADSRRAYVHIARGEATVNGEALHAGDALMLENEAAVRIESGKKAEVLVFDLP